MVICALFGCNSDSSCFKELNISFYRLPRDKKLKKTWLLKLNRPKSNLPAEDNIRICHLHFTDECFERDLKNELLGLPTRRLLKKDAIPTILSQVSLETPKKRLSSVRREDDCNKRQMFEEAIFCAEKQAREIKEQNTKGFQCQPSIKEQTSQTAIPLKSKSTNTAKLKMKSIGVQVCLPCDHEINDSDNSFITEEADFFTNNPNLLATKSIFSEDSDCTNDVTVIDELDSSFHCSEADQQINLELDDLNESDDESPINIKNSAFVVYWSSLILLLQYCLICRGKATIKKVFTRGCGVVIEYFCENGHNGIWRGQPLVQRRFHGNIVLAASILFSANTYEKIRKFFELADIAFFSHASYYKLQKKYLFGVANEAWTNEKLELEGKIYKAQQCILSGDGRCDSPGHNAKYLTYSFLEQSLSKIIAVSVTQCTEAGNSNRMEKYGFQKALSDIESKFIVNRVTTDRHVQIKKFMREERPEIDHQFDVWHVCKNIRAKLRTNGKKHLEKFSTNG